MTTLSKVLISTSLGIATICVVVVAPVFGQSSMISKKPTAEYVARVQAKNARLDAALNALSAGDEKRMADVRAAMAELEPGSLYRPAFAKAFDRRGDHATAYTLESERAHFLELSVPDDAEMSFYAALAEKAGHPDEAQWARARMGENGHFRVWEIGTLGALAQSKRLHGQGYLFQEQVSRFARHGKELYPALNREIDSLSAKVLVSSAAKIQAMHDEVASGSSSQTIKP